MALVSALTGEGIAPLLEQIEARIGEARETREVTVAAEDGAGLAWAYAHAEVLSRKSLPADGAQRLRLRVPPARMGELEHINFRKVRLQGARRDAGGRSEASAEQLNRCDRGVGGYAKAA